jgi:hypothetical protein
MTTPTVTTAPNNFNIDTFNKNFDSIHSRTNKINDKIEAENLDKLNNTEYEKQIIDLSISEIIINMFRCWISIFDDINNGNYKNLLTKKHRLFYIGLTIFIIGLLLYLFDYFMESDDKLNSKSDITNNKTSNTAKTDNVINETRNIVINKYYNTITDSSTSSYENNDLILPINNIINDKSK